MTKSMMLTGVATFALLGSSGAVAQEAPAIGEDSAPAEIVVTAQKRSERLQDVPVAVSVVSGATLANQGGVNIESAQYLVPSLNFRKAGTAINQSLYLRGVGTATFSIAGEPSVSTVVDGVVFSRSGEAFSDLVDIDRLEVLRGPQGTLFGKNASAGVVNIVTKRPTDQFEGSLEASYFDKNEFRGRAVVNLPLSTGVAARVTGFYGKYDGNIFNRALNRQVNGYERYGVRGTLVAEVSPDVTFTLIADWRKANDDCCAQVVAGPPLTATGAVNTAVLTYIQPALPALPALQGDQGRVVNQNVLTQSLQTSWGVSFQADATLAGQTVTSITSYRRYDENEIRDGDFLSQGYVDATVATGGRFNLQDSRDTGPQTGKTFTQEFRLTSPGREFFDYVIGAYYSHADTQRTFSRTAVTCDVDPRPTVLTPCTGRPTTTAFGTATFGSVFKNFALFGQGALNLGSGFRLIGGLRYTVDQLDVFHKRVTTLTGPGIGGNFDAGVFNNGATVTNPVTGAVSFAAGSSNGIPFRNKTTNTNWSGKAGAQYEISRNSMLYATYARGYKGPAFNTFFNQGTATGGFPIAAETSDSYEIGAKNTLFGGRLVVNLAAFYAKYRNFQAEQPDVLFGVTIARFTNAGDVSTRGAELDFLWRPMLDLNISGGVSYTDAKVDQFRLPTGGANTGLIPSGTPLGYAPKWKGSLNGDYRIRTGGAIDVLIGAQGSYQSSQLSLFDASAVVRAAGTIKAYGLLDLSAGITSSDDRFRVVAQIKNVFDTSFASAILSGSPGGSYRYLIPREADRYFGITAKVNFGTGR